MTGLIVIAIAVPLLLAYLWLARAAVRYAKRKTGSNAVAALVIVGILVITFGDTVFNRWYHKEVLCKREDVGIRILERVKLPQDFLDDKTQRPRFPLPLDRAFFTRFSTVELRTSAGLFPLTAHGRIERSIVDSHSGKVLARFVDYWPAGGPWWGAPIAWFDESNLVGWLLGRRHVPTCLRDSAPYSLLGVSEYFYAIDQGESK